MGTIHLGVNLEFVRHDDKSMEWGIEKAAELGYEYVEPMVHWGRELLSEAGYFHSVSMLDDPYRIKQSCERAGVRLSGLSAHTPLCKPEISTEYLKQAIRFADRLVHLHAKDISVEQSDDQRGKVSGTPVGCACGEGVIDWARVVDICRPCKRNIVFSVECGTIEQAERSVEYLRPLL